MICMQNRPMRVFVFEYLSGGGTAEAADPALLAQGLAMRDALLADLRCIDGCTATCAEAASALPLLEAVRRHVALHDRAWIIAPESGRILEALHGAVGAARWIGCDADSIRITSSKSATLRQLAEHGLATPLAFAANATRWVVKPDDGAGATDTRVHESRRIAEADRATRDASATLEPWVEGDALSVSLLCASGSAELLAINRQHLELDARGGLSYRGVTLDALPAHDRRAGALRTMAGAVARALPGLRGYVGIDLVWHATRGPVVIEINPRLTCSYVGLSAALGRNLAAEVLAMHG